MDTPQPIDVNRLKNMLGGAKKIMQKVESGDYETGNVDSSTLALSDQLVENTGNVTANPTRNAAPKIQNGNTYYPNLEKSKLPDAIKKAMVEQPIPQIDSIPQTFTLEEVMDFDRDEKPTPPPSTPKTNKRQNINEGYGPQLNENQIRDIIRDEMKDIVKEEMIEFFTKYFAKTLAEDTQKKLIQHLIKEGKLTISKKK